MIRRILPATAIVCLVSVSQLSCKDQGKETAAQARTNVASLLSLTEKDVGEIERGLPEGAKKIATLYAKGGDPRQDVPAVRRELLKMRREVPDLNVAKSTFFALADDHGVAIRNDLETDVMAGQNLLTLFPDLAKAEAGAFVTTSGAFPNGAPPTAPDKDWIAAAPVKKEDGTIGGIVVTGWSYRRFAYHLQETLKHDLTESAKTAKDNGKVPIVYVALFDKDHVYAAPQTPDVNEKALADAKLADKTSAGPSEGVLNITEREFGYAAAREPKLGDGVGIVVLRSDL